MPRNPVAMRAALELLRAAGPGATLAPRWPPKRPGGPRRWTVNGDDASDDPRNWASTTTVSALLDAGLVGWTGSRKDAVRIVQPGDYLTMLGSTFLVFHVAAGDAASRGLDVAGRELAVRIALVLHGNSYKLLGIDSRPPAPVAPAWEITSLSDARTGAPPVYWLPAARALQIMRCEPVVPEGAWLLYFHPAPGHEVTPEDLAALRHVLLWRVRALSAV